MKFIALNTKNGIQKVRPNSIYRIQFDGADKNFPVRISCKLGREYFTFACKEEPDYDEAS